MDGLLSAGDSISELLPDTDDQADTQSSDADENSIEDESEDQADTQSTDDSEEDEVSEDGDDEQSDKDEPVKSEKHKVKVNGKEFEVDTAELVSGYQRNTDYVQKTQALAARNRELTAAHSSIAEQYQAKLAQANAIVAGVRQLLVGDVDSAEMRQLQATDTQAWMAQRMLMQDRIAQVDNVLSNVNANYERHVAEAKKQNAESASKTLEQERAIIAKNIPDWNDETALNLAKYLNKAGFSQDELSSVSDARSIILANKARLWDEYQANKKAVPAKKATPEVRAQVKSSGGGSTSRTKQAIVDKQLAQKAKATGSLRDAGALIASRLG